MTEKELMSDNVHGSLDNAITAARAGRRDEAARLLRQVVADNPFNADAWVWLGGVSPDVREQRSALEHALTITPGNQKAQQGLQWLRQQHPNIFNEAATDSDDTSGGARTYDVVDQRGASGAASETRPRNTRTTPNYEIPAASAATVPMATSYGTPSTMPASEAQTAAMPVAYAASASAAPISVAQPMYPPLPSAPSQTDRMAVAAPPRSIDASHTDRMPVAPAAPADDTVVERRSPAANAARWVLLIFWLLGFGAIATLAALTFAFPAYFQQAINPTLAPYGLQLDPSSLETTRLTTGGVLTAIAIFDLIMVIGLLSRGRWAWVINLLVALAVTAGTIALAALALTMAAPNAGFNLLSPALQPLLGLIIFTLIYLVLSFASRRAFFRRRVRPTM